MVALYGNEKGDWAVLEAAEGVIPSPYIDELVYLGTPNDVITKLNYTMHQSEIAKLAGVTQQAVSRYIKGTAPNLKPEGWRAIVKAYFAETERLSRA